MAHDVFISYSNKNKSIADAICFSLESKDIRCWYAPRDIEPGSDWAASIISAIKAAKVMVLVFTDESNISRQVLREVSNAVSAGLTIIPMKLTASEPTEGMQYYLSAVHWLDAINCETEEAIGNLTQKVEAVLNSEDFIAPQDYRSDSAPAKKSRGLIAALAAVLVVAVIAGVMFFSKGSAGPGKDTDTNTDPDVAVAVQTDERLSIENPNNSYTQGNLQCNMINGGIAASDDNYIYYRSNDNYSLYRMKKDGKDQELVLAEPVSYISVYEGFIYFYSQTDTPYIGRYEIKSGRTDTLYSGKAESIRIVNDRMYFRNAADKLYLYSMDLNGGNPKPENEIPELNNLMLDGEYIYYLNTQDGNRLYRAAMDGSEYQKLTDCECYAATICEDYIIYNNKSANTLEALNIRDFKNYTIAEGFYLAPTVSGYGITGISQFGEHYIAKFGLNKLTAETLASEDAEDCCQLDGMLFCRSKESGEYYAVPMSGASKITLK